MNNIEQLDKTLDEDTAIIHDIIGRIAKRWPTILKFNSPDTLVVNVRLLSRMIFVNWADENQVSSSLTKEESDGTWESDFGEEFSFGSEEDVDDLVRTELGTLEDLRVVESVQAHDPAHRVPDADIVRAICLALPPNVDVRVRLVDEDANGFAARD